MAIWRCMLAALGFWLGAQACAADGCGPYRVGLREYPRLYQRDAAGQFGGLDKDFFEALAERSGCRLEFQLESQPRLWARLARGDVDLASWVVSSEQRATVVRILPIMSGRMTAVTWRDAGIRSEAEFLADRTLRAVAISQALYGAGYDPLLAELRAQGRVSEAADFDTAWRAFAGRRAALMLAYPWSLASQPPELLAQLQLTDWHAAEPATASGLALSRRNVREADVQRFEHALRAMRQDGSLAQILARHLPPNSFRLLPP